MTELQEMKNSRSMVVGFKNNSVFSYINMFLDKQESDCTKSSYKGYIKEFFEYTTGKDLSILTWDDLKKINSDDVELFVTYLLKKENKKTGKIKNSNGTVNSKIAGLKSLFDYLHTKNNDIDSVIFYMDSLDDNPNSYSPFSNQERKDLYSFAESQTYRDKGLIASLYFQTCYVTGIRKSAVLNMTWKDIKREEDVETGAMVWVIKVIDKGGKEDPTAISDKFYEKLLQLKKDDDNKKRIFNISDKTLYKIIGKFCEQYNIDREERNIGIHSLKTSSCDSAWKMTKDVLKTQKQGHHGDPNTTMKKYAKGERNYTSQLSYRMDEEIDLSLLDNYSKEELLDAIKKCDIGVFINISNKIKK